MESFRDLFFISLTFVFPLITVAVQRKIYHKKRIFLISAYCNSLVLSVILHLYYRVLVKDNEIIDIYYDLCEGDFHFLFFEIIFCFLLSFINVEPRSYGWYLSKKIKIIGNILSFISFNFIIFTFFLKKNFGAIELEQVFYIYNLKTNGKSFIFFVIEYITKYLLFTILLTYIWMFCLTKLPLSYIITARIRINTIKMPTVMIIALFVISIITMMNISSLKKAQTGNFIQDNYVDPEKVFIKWPEKQRNLIVLILESMESSYSSKEYGGGGDYNYIPNLTKLALDPENVHFSNTDKLGGAGFTRLSSWSIAGHFAIWSGLPMKTDKLDADVDMPYAYTMLEMLSERNYTMSYYSSAADEYGESKLYKRHCKNITMNFEDTIRKKAGVKSLTGWGTHDYVTLNVALEELKEKDKKKDKNPFLMTVVTIDTHFPYGFECEHCIKTHDFSLYNAIMCSDREVYKFVNEVKKLQLYNDTTIVILGDHLSMSYIIANKYRNYFRTVYNLIINPIKKAVPKVMKNRKFLTHDWFPTILSAIGVEIKNERLGLGTNLFSGKETYSEYYGPNVVNENMKSKSGFFYDKIILGKNITELKIKATELYFDGFATWNTRPFCF